MISGVFVKSFFCSVSFLTRAGGASGSADEVTSSLFSVVVNSFIFFIWRKGETTMVPTTVKTIPAIIIMMAHPAFGLLPDVSGALEDSADIES